MNKHKSYFDLTPEPKQTTKPQRLTYCDHEKDLALVKADGPTYSKFVKLLSELERYADNPSNYADQDNYLYLAGLIKEAREAEITLTPVDTGESLPQLSFAPKPDEQLRMF